jgi:hypothetical protein
MGGQQYDASNNQVSPLSAASMGELQELGMTMLVTQVVVTPTSLASDETCQLVCPRSAPIQPSIPGSYRRRRRIERRNG